MGTTQEGKTFTGTLVRRQYKPGQPCVQLVFQNKKELQLSLSRNISMIKSLKVGQAYRIEGPEYQLGEKTFINEPDAVPVEELPAKRSKKRWVLAFGTAFVFVLAGTVVAARHFAGGHNTVQAQSGGSYVPQTAVQGADTQSSTNENTTSLATDTSADTTTQPQQTAPSAPAPTTTTHHTTTTSGANTQTTPVPAPSPTPAPAPPPQPPANTNDKTTDPTPTDPTAPADTPPANQQQTPTDTTPSDGQQPTTP